MAKTDVATLARNAVYAKVAAGKMHRPNICEECNTQPPLQSDGKTGIQAHHFNGYENRFDVRWLCLKCHCKADGGVRAKYSPENIKEIRYGDMSVIEKAKKFGINRRTIYRIIAGESWKNVE